MKLNFGYRGVEGDTQKNFKLLDTALAGEDLLKGHFEFREFTLSAPSYPAVVSFPHKLLFVPRDVLQLSVIGGTITWSYASFTQTALVAIISAPTVVRAFIGTYAET